MRRLRSALVSVTAAASLAPAVCGETGNACLDSVLPFDATALEGLVLSPQDALRDPVSFWEDHPAQRFTTAWADGNGFSVPLDRWRRRVEEFAALPLEARLGSSLMRLAKSIVESREELAAGALSHVCAFLPVGADAGVPVYFTAFIEPRAFVTGGIVINASAPYWNGNPDNIRNALLHEIWHVGYSRLRGARAEEPLVSDVLHGVLDQLQNEGTATYVGYRARGTFPAPDERDYQMLDSEGEVRRSLERVQELLDAVGRVRDPRLKRNSWRVGVDGRAYYVAGAHMAWRIDEALGRERLVRTVADGPVDFVAAYNSIAEEGRRILIPSRELIASRRHGLLLKRGSIFLATVLVVVFGFWLLRRRASG